MAEKKCRYCSMMIPGDAKICPYCRKSQSVATTRNIIVLLVEALANLSICHPEQSEGSVFCTAEADPSLRSG